MSRRSKARRAVLLAVSVLAVAAATVGVSFSAFAGQTAAAANNISAAPDFRGPTIADQTIGKSAGNATGYIRTGGTYRVYANVTDVGTPPSGIATVTANVNNVTAGQTAAPMTAGSYTVGGKTYNYRSAQLTAGALPNGPVAFTVSATDAAANASSGPGTVTIDSTAPAVGGISAANGGATQSRAEVGDVFTFTTTDTLDTFSILANWTGAATTVQVQLVNNNGGDRLVIRDSTGATVLPYGTINLGRTDYCTATVTFAGSTMTQTAGAITVTLGGTVTGTPTTAAGTGTMVWTPSATATDRAGNAMPTTAYNEAAPVDRDF